MITNTHEREYEKTIINLVHQQDIWCQMALTEALQIARELVVTILGLEPFSGR